MLSVRTQDSLLFCGSAQKGSTRAEVEAESALSTPWDLVPTSPVPHLLAAPTDFLGEAKLYIALNTHFPSPNPWGHCYLFFVILCYYYYYFFIMINVLFNPHCTPPPQTSSSSSIPETLVLGHSVSFSFACLFLKLHICMDSQFLFSVKFCCCFVHFCPRYFCMVSSLFR